VRRSPRPVPRNVVPRNVVPRNVVPRRVALGSAILAILAITALAACNSDGRTLRPASPSQTQSVYTPTTTTVAATTATVDGAILPAATAEVAPLAFVLDLPWTDGGAIDSKYTCNGIDVHPELSWLGAPSGAIEMALVVTDTDADDFVHWAIAGLDPFDPELGEGDVPVGAIEGLNGFSTPSTPVIGWRGPCPPAGVAHHYQFTLYALDQQVDLPTGAPAADLLQVIDSSAIGTAQVTGVYATP
jgi:Raf kinase inhibitor-like YbhB/YbcL family protein